jgi:hypothetical protein
MKIGRDVLPKVNGKPVPGRLRAPDGTRFERTEDITVKTLHVLEDMVGKENIQVTSAWWECIQDNFQPARSICL